MTEIQKLIALIEDAHAIQAVKSDDDLRRLFETSGTDIASMFEGGLDGLLGQAQGKGEERMADIRAYLLWEYIARNVSDLYQDHDFVKAMLLEKIEGGTDR
jgi:hypothetical protein